MLPFSRIVALLIAGVLCFGVLLPMALARHVPALAAFIVVVFLAYLAANVVLWLRTRSGA
jgi:uncharacterized membrane protein YsdA (DUF1294 family)